MVGQLPARVTYGGAGLGCWKKRMLGCNDSDTGCNITWHESEPTSNRSFFVRKFVESILNKEKQMTTAKSNKFNLIGASSTKADKWHHYYNNNVCRTTPSILVYRLQMRIAKAIREKKHNKAKVLQRLLTHSYSAKLEAVKRVTSNKGRNTAGVDGVIWKTAEQKYEAALSLRNKGYKPLPVRRIYIPKSGSKKGLRPLGIPTMFDRAMQALHLLALEPVAETKADPNSYGFRPHRGCADAIEQCFNSLVRKACAKWVLEGDIKSCFDSVDFNWLENNCIMNRKVLSKWLRAGYLEKGSLHATKQGTPQGSVISPRLITTAFDGFEATIKSGTKDHDKVNVIVYADDFVITGNSKELLENHIKPKVVKFLKERGLELSEEKTKLTHIEQGFDFLGFNVRKYREKLLIKPSKKSIKTFLMKVRQLIKDNPAVKTETLIQRLNQMIRGWAIYFRCSVAKRTFSYIDSQIFKALMRWTKRRHPNKGARWVVNKYFRSRGLKNWVFSTKVKVRNKKVEDLDLLIMSDFPIIRHTKIRAEANPYDPKFTDYFNNRKKRKEKKDSTNAASKQEEETTIAGLGETGL